MWDALWLDVRLATMEEGRGAYGVIDDGALGVSDGRIVFCGRRDDLFRRVAPERSPARCTALTGAG